MDNNTNTGFFNAVARMPRYAPALVAAFLAGLLLLFIKELPENCRSYLVPSLVIYALGATILATIHRLVALSYQEKNPTQNESGIPVTWRVGFCIVHVVWCACLIIYLFWRGVL